MTTPKVSEKKEPCHDSELRKYDAYNREMPQKEIEQVHVIEKSAFDKAVAALKGYVSNCPFGCLHGDVGDESQFVECEACKPARETLREIGVEL